jgi:hypothetical protein
MSNQVLIDYERQQRQQNNEAIAVFEWQMKSVDEMISQANSSIDGYNAQKTEFQSKIKKFGEDNAKIDEIISILSS